MDSPSAITILFLRSGFSPTREICSKEEERIFWVKECPFACVRVSTYVAACVCGYVCERANKQVRTLGQLGSSSDQNITINCRSSGGFGSRDGRAKIITCGRIWIPAGFPISAEAIIPETTRSKPVSKFRHVLSVARSLRLCARLITLNWTKHFWWNSADSVKFNHNKFQLSPHFGMRSTI